MPKKTKAQPFSNCLLTMGATTTCQKECERGLGLSKQFIRRTNRLSIAPLHVALDIPQQLSGFDLLKSSKHELSHNDAIFNPASIGVNMLSRSN